MSYAPQSYELSELRGSFSGAILSFLGLKNKHGQIEFVRLICPLIYNCLIMSGL